MRCTQMYPMGPQLPMSRVLTQQLITADQNCTETTIYEALDCKSQTEQQCHDVCYPGKYQTQYYQSLQKRNQPLTGPWLVRGNGTGADLETVGLTGRTQSRSRHPPPGDRGGDIDIDIDIDRGGYIDGQLKFQRCILCRSVR